MDQNRFGGPIELPCYAVIFSSQRTRDDENGDYGATSERMVELARRQPGFLGVESARDDEGFGITVSYWRDEASIAAWKADAEHREAQRRGRTDFYERFELRVARVERQHRFVRRRGKDAAQEPRQR